MISRQFGEKFYRILILVWKPYFETQLPPKNDFAVIHLKKALTKFCRNYFFYGEPTRDLKWFFCIAKLS